MFNQGIKVLSRFVNTLPNVTVRAPLSISTLKVSGEKILFVFHKGDHGRDHQYDVNIADAFRKSKRYEFVFCECDNEHDLFKNIKTCEPKAIIYSYSPRTMPWLTPLVTRSYSIPQLGIIHGVLQDKMDSVKTEMFDIRLCTDPTVIERDPTIIKTTRLIPPYINLTNLPEIPTIGSFGFGFEWEGFETLIEAVQQEFDVANIHIRMPFDGGLDQNNKQQVVALTRKY